MKQKPIGLLSVSRAGSNSNSSSGTGQRCSSGGGRRSSGRCPLAISLRHSSASPLVRRPLRPRLATAADALERWAACAWMRTHAPLRRAATGGVRAAAWAGLLGGACADGASGAPHCILPSHRESTALIAVPAALHLVSLRCAQRCPCRFS